MINITTIQNGFIMREQLYYFTDEITIVSESQCDVPTDRGVILLDLSCTINNALYDNINLFVNALTETI